MHVIYLVFATLLVNSVSGDITWRFLGELSSLPSTCDSDVYCRGVLLHDAQLAKLYNDSKTFVDLKLKYPETEVISNYENLRKDYNGQSPPFEKIQEFVNNHFEKGDELEVWTPTDYKPVPSMVHKVFNPRFKAWLVKLNEIFLNLSRKMKSDVEENPDFYSLLYCPNGFIIPGGRFTELYYWDSYWIVWGLLLFEMETTARGVIENFFHLIGKYGFMLNGSRKYYVRRSQPPLLIPMVHKYYKHTKDLDFVRENIELMEKEFTFWMENRMVLIEKDGKSYKLAHYYPQSSGPRPESYREDYALAEALPTEEEKDRLYVSVKSAAESGQDFSTRWFIKEGTNAGNLSDIDAPHILPVDLNAFLHHNAYLLSIFFEALGDLHKAAEYKSQAHDLLDAIETFLWNEEQGIWLDYDLKNLKSRDYFYLSNFVPLWTESYSQNKEELSKKVLKYLDKSKVDQYIGGLPSSLINSGQQWDLRNGWPPQQTMVIEGLDRLDTPAAKRTARHYAEKWVRTNYKGYELFQKMFEKYDVTTLGRTGSGGEYVAQTGFGWTIGTVLGLLDMYRDMGYDEGSELSDQ